MISLNRPGNSWLHRLPAGPKLLALIVLISAISIIGSNPLGAVAALVVVFVLFTFAFPSSAASAAATTQPVAMITSAHDSGALLFVKQLWSLKWLLLLIIVPQLIFGAKASTVLPNALRLTDAILLATLFTLTTKNSELMLAIERTFRPLARIGIKPQTASLTLAMTINAIPMITKFLAQTKEAQQARGVKPTPVLITVPLLVASLKYADEFAEALAARGVEV
jgi:biotin transport system permease protein